MLSFHRYRALDHSVRVEDDGEVHIEPRHPVLHFPLRYQVPHHFPHLPLPPLPLGRYLLVELVRQVAVLVEVLRTPPAVHERRSSAKQ